ncbi:Crp/Fnr family transcriptional regulator [Phocaeicola salanitronis]|mgnify:FL=1|uniref:Crp/Fnr family transcriptional regulator n=1 Tax=Phocaeicola salanitronis TaxID=376805 RepID=UPI0025A436C6|nr:Crp/Fnr family transcriptional regulator [Phocaeicola salanitronis]MDM8305842.1 Crp/Fnr family transcriptional regulator [Phocaeicola salanitronis]
MTTTSIDIARQMVSDYHLQADKESTHALADILICKKYKKGEMILNEGEVCKCMRYVEKGMLRQYYFKHEKDMTEHISYEKGVVICLESYFRQEPTRLMIEALEPSVIWEIDKEQIDKLAVEHSVIGVLYRKILEDSLIESQIKADTLRFEPAHERYNKLLQIHPEILKRAPLVYIASLLQMTPETLSRVRAASLTN